MLKDDCCLACAVALLLFVGPNSRCLALIAACCAGQNLNLLHFYIHTYVENILEEEIDSNNFHADDIEQLYKKPNSTGRLN